MMIQQIKVAIGKKKGEDEDIAELALSNVENANGKEIIKGDDNGKTNTQGNQMSNSHVKNISDENEEMDTGGKSSVISKHDGDNAVLGTRNKKKDGDKNVNHCKTDTEGKMDDGNEEWKEDDDDNNDTAEQVKTMTATEENYVT